MKQGVTLRHTQFSEKIHAYLFGKLYGYFLPIISYPTEIVSVSQNTISAGVNTNFLHKSPFGLKP